VANQKKIKIKKKPSQRHIGEYGELDGGGVYSENFLFLQGCKSANLLSWMGEGGILDFFYEDANQTKIFTGVKNTINPNNNNKKI